MSRAMILAAGGACALACADVARAQWVTFEDETSTRLVLTNFTIGDAEEKDTVVADLDNDGDDDIVVARKRPFSQVGPRADLLLINENGVLVDRTDTLAPQFLSIPTDARDVIAKDFDGDGWIDIVFVTTFSQQPQYYRNRGEDGSGNWLGFVNESASRFPTITTSPLQFCAGWGGDLNGDGHADLYFANYNPGGLQANSDILFINDGNGVFTNETIARMGNLRNSAFGTNVEFADLDGDGDNEIIKTSTLYSVSPWNQLGVFLLFNDGDGFFNWTGETAGTVDPYMFRVADYNNDGMMDIYTVHDGSDSVRILTAATPDTNLSYQTFGVSASRVGGFGGNVKQVDIDNDGDLDLGVSPIDVDIANCGTNGDFALLRNPGNGQFSDPWEGMTDRNIHEEAHDFDFIDLNNDGCMDIFMGLCSGWRVFIQTTEGCGVVALVGDLNGDGFVNGADLATLLANWGPCANPNQCPANLNDDDVVNGADLATLLANWT